MLVSHIDLLLAFLLPVLTTSHCWRAWSCWKSSARSWRQSLLWNTTLPPHRKQPPASNYGSGTVVYISSKRTQLHPAERIKSLFKWSTAVNWTGPLRTHWVDILSKMLYNVFLGFTIMVLYVRLHVLEPRIQSKELQEISISNACVKSCKISDVMTLMIFLLF